MNCILIQRRLLACEQPDFPPPEVRAHLISCPECRSWQARAVDLEQRLHGLSVPPSAGPGAFLTTFLAEAPATLPLRPSRKPYLREVSRRKLAVAFALAAALAVFALAWWAGPHSEQASSLAADTKKPAPDQLASFRQRLDGAGTPAELADLAKAVQEEAHKVRADSDRLDEVARFFVQVVRDHLLPQARALPAGEQRALLPAVAESLRKLESEASRLSAELAGTHPASAASFQDMAAAARDADRRLLALARGEAA
jgi:hypothetical protein